MLVFLQIPGSTTSAYQSFRKALGDDAVGWVGRNLKDGDLADAASLERFRVLGGRIPLAKAAALEQATMFATVVSDPIARTKAQWAEAIGDFNHPHHDATHTFMLRELFEEKHPFAAAMSNVATRILMPTAGEAPSAAAALAAIQSRRFVLADTDHVRPLSKVLARFLDLPPGSLDEAGFRAPPAPPIQTPRGELRRLIRAANEEDLALIEGLKRLERGNRHIVRTRGEAPNPRGTGRGRARAET